jgi:heat shock protein 90kDa beta
MIQEEFEDLMPRYLNFIRGVVDTDDLPLNVSRDQLQQMKMIKVMSKKLVRKAIDMIRDLAEESYEYKDKDEEKRMKLLIIGVNLSLAKRKKMKA